MKRILNTTLIIFMFLVSTAFSFYHRGGSFDGLSVGNDNHAKMIAVESELKMADLSTSGSRTKSLPAGQDAGERPVGSGGPGRSGFGLGHVSGIPSSGD